MEKRDFGLLRYEDDIFWCLENFVNLINIILKLIKLVSNIL